MGCNKVSHTARMKLITNKHKYLNFLKTCSNNIVFLLLRVCKLNCMRKVFYFYYLTLVQKKWLFFFKTSNSLLILVIKYKNNQYTKPFRNYNCKKIRKLRCTDHFTKIMFILRVCNSQITSLLQSTHMFSVHSNMYWFVVKKPVNHKPRCKIKHTKCF